MEVRSVRDFIQLNDPENAFAGPRGAAKGAGVKVGHQPLQLVKRKALGDRNENVCLPLARGKSQDDEKACLKPSRPVTRSYKNITAKVDTRHTTKPITTVKNAKENVQKPLSRENSENSVPAADSITAKLRQTKISNGATKLPIRKKSDENIVQVPVSHTAFIESLQNNIVPKRRNRSEAYSSELIGVEDIDSADGKSPILMGIYIKDIYNYLMELETQFPIKENHLDSQICVTPKMRAMLIDWLIEVHEQFSFMQETLHLTVAIVDRYLQEVNSVQRKQIQLIGITAMFIAGKYEEMFMPEIHDFVYITDNSYTKSEILQCEQAILVKLQYCLGRPYPLHFERRFIKAARVQVRNHQLAKYLIDLCLVEYDMAHYRPSELAAAAVCLSISVLGDKPPSKCWTPTLAFYSGYKYDHLIEIIKKLAIITMNAGTSRFKAVTVKYNSSKYGKVPSYPELRGAMLKSIAEESPKV